MAATQNCIMAGWKTEPHFRAPMVCLPNGTPVFTRDVVLFYHPHLGFTKGLVTEFFQKGADVTLPNDALILYEDLCLLCMSWPYLQNALCSGMENTSILRDLMTRRRCYIFLFFSPMIQVEIKVKSGTSLRVGIYSLLAFQGRQMDGMSMYILSAALIPSPLRIWRDQYLKIWQD